MMRAASWIGLRGAVAVVAVCAVGVLGCGSDGSNGGGPTDGAVPDGSGTLDGTVTPRDTGVGDDAGPGDDGGIIAPYDAGPLCDPDASVDIDCTGRCGPVRDACSGTVKMCGGCTAATTADGGTEVRVCDLATNTCVKPRITCADLGAECGTVRDTCGDYLDCPDTSPKGCAAGQECDPDTHKCTGCETVTCGDLGFECGFAWLGCGPDTQSNYTDCGGCAADTDGGARTCNGVFHTCEPSCTPKTAAVLCAAAKAKNGVQCGIISNGCGGTVSCDSVAGFGCAAGQSCGVRGIANRCDTYETPAECSVTGRDCGDITSSCTGLKVHCGDCATGQVCNANGVCGTPCTAKKCTDYAQFACGTFDDGCGATISCGTCPGGVCDQATNTCCANKKCATDYAGHCGTALPTGCGATTEPCTCATGVCTATGGASAAPAPGALGSCCQPHDAGYYLNMAAKQCGTKLPDGCGGVVTANCPSGFDCVGNSMGQPGPAPADGVVGSCCQRTDSCSLASGTCGPVAGDSCRINSPTTTCNKCVSGTSCVASACCHPAPGCNTGTGGEGAECNDSKAPVDTGCGSARTCSCSGGRTCWCTNHVCVAPPAAGADGTGSCKSALSCSSAAYTGKCGVKLDNGVGGAIDCNCGGGQVCSATANNTTGTCSCNNPTHAAYTCANVPNGPSTGGDACGTFDNGCGGSIVCNCAAGLTCNTSANPNVCCTAASCPTAALGSACGSINNGCSTASCGCPGGAGNENFSCSATSKTCVCTPDTCRGRTGPQPDRCGGTLQCGG